MTTSRKHRTRRPRRGRCRIYHGSKWASSDDSEWVSSEWLGGGAPRKYVGTRDIAGKSFDVWLAYPKGDNAPRDLYVAQRSSVARRRTR